MPIFGMIWNMRWKICNDIMAYGKGNIMIRTPPTTLLPVKFGRMLSLAIPAMLLVCFYVRADEIIAGPYLQDVKPDGITIMWETDTPATSMIEYGETGITEQGCEYEEKTTIHEVLLRGLKEETRYRYRITSGKAQSKEYQFKTAVKQDTPFRFVVWGDSRTNIAKHKEVANAIAQSQPDLAINVGNVVTDGTKCEDWRREYWGPISSFAHSVPTYIAIGNHEKNASWFYQYVVQPDHENWGSFDYGSAHFIILDSNGDYSDDSEQYQWFKSDLASESCQEAKWRFVFFHHPPYTKGGERPGYEGESLVRIDLMPLLEEYEVDIVFNGHTHAYERGSLNGVHYIITGGGGAALDKSHHDVAHIGIYKAEYHFCRVDVHAEQIAVSAITPNGKVIDSFTLKDRTAR